MRTRIAIVTGGAGGIGLSIAQRLASDGCHVVVADRDLEGAGQAVNSIVALGGLASAMEVDVGDQESVQRLVANTVESHRALDIMVSNAGVGRLYDFLDQPFDNWKHTLSINLNGVFLCGQAAGRVMRLQGAGTILNIASIAGLRAGSGRCAYGTSKAAVIHLTRQMAVDLATHGITVNALAPGPVETLMTQGAYTPETRQQYAALIPLARFGTSEEVAGAAAFLTGGDARYITGQTLFVDGGFTAAGVMARDIVAGQGSS